MFMPTRIGDFFNFFLNLLKMKGKLQEKWLKKFWIGHSKKKSSPILCILFREQLFKSFHNY